MTKTPSELRYTKTHEWTRLDDDGIVCVGITDHAQKMLGDFVFVELPEIGHTLTGGKECGVVESVKAASDFYSPAAGEVTEINVTLVSSPDLLNSDPYGEGWLFRFRPADPKSLEKLLDAEAYQKHVASEA